MQGVKDGRRYYLTAAIGAGVDKIVNTDPAMYQQYMDYVNVMPYDFHRARQTSTNFHAPLYHDPADPSTSAVAKYNVTAGPNGDGLYQKATGAAKGTYDAGIDDYKILKTKVGKRGVHPVTKQMWLYTSNGEF